MRPKPIRLSDLFRYDRENGESLVRSLEMEVEGVLPTAHCLQFWTDVQVYGIDEATLYLREGLSPEAYASLVAKVASIRAIVTAPTPPLDAPGGAHDPD